MKFPLILIDDGDVSVFSSIRDIERYVESPDVGDYLLFDASGQRLGLGAPQRQTGIVVDIDRVQVQACDEAFSPQVLVDTLRVFLRRLGVSVSDEEQLSELVQTLVETVGYTE